MARSWSVAASRTPELMDDPSLDAIWIAAAGRESRIAVSDRRRWLVTASTRRPSAPPRAS
jgi:hypothetical protein